MAVSRLSRQSVQAGFPKQQTIWDQTSQTAAMDAITSAQLPTNSTAFLFNNIPATYTHLQIRGLVRSTYAQAIGIGWQMQMGPASGIDTGNNYSYHLLGGDGSSVFTGGQTGVSFMGVGEVNGSSSTAGMWTTFIIDILDYSNTNKTKNIRVLEAQEVNGSGKIQLASGLWNSTQAVGTISLNCSQTLVSGCTASIYGIK